MSKEISQKVYILEDTETAPEMIDNAFRTGYLYQSPVYIGIPSNIGELNIDSNLLDTPIDLAMPENNKKSGAEVSDWVVSLIRQAKSPIILFDACASRHEVRKETAKLAEITQFPVFATPIGKSAFDENNPRFGGCYVGSLSLPEVAEVVEIADLVLSVDAMLFDFNTRSFSYGYKTSNIVELHSDYIKIRKATYNVQMKPILATLPSRLTSADPKLTTPVPALLTHVVSAKDTPMNQNYIWARLSKFFKPGDVIVTETGTSSFGVTNTIFP